MIRLTNQCQTAVKLHEHTDKGGQTKVKSKKCLHEAQVFQVLTEQVYRKIEYFDSRFIFLCKYGIVISTASCLSKPTGSLLQLYKHRNTFLP